MHPNYPCCHASICIGDEPLREDGEGGTSYMPEIACRAEPLLVPWVCPHASPCGHVHAQREGYVSRAAYKLKEIQKKHHLIKPGGEPLLEYYFQLMHSIAYNGKHSTCVQ